jgi:hypothetical protein
MRILIACEFSGTVREAFRKLGHDAWSCDIIPSDDNSPYHIQGDVLDIINNGWDMMIAHPPCTRLTVTGNKWYKPEYADRFPNIHNERDEAIEFFMKLVNAPIGRICIENPIGIMSTKYKKPNQIIQPYQFGHEASKATCLWLKGLQKLEHTNIVNKGEFVEFKSGKRMSKWYCDAAKFPSKQREKIRNKTFQGIADAMAEQWGNLD